jgi:two-component system, OmpR family, response regulator VanR
LTGLRVSLVLMRVLLVEDEPLLADALARGLRLNDMAVDVALDGVSALRKAEFEDYDVVVLDRDLPGVHGDEVCRRLSVRDVSPAILMLTAASQTGDVVEGLSLGADDYLSKPVALEELVARLRALARRPRRQLPPCLRYQDLELDVARRSVTRNGRAIELTRKELAVLELLIEDPGVVVSAEEILRRAWDENANPFTSAVRMVMVGLRRKLGEPPLIETLTGQGYRLR